MHGRSRGPDQPGRRVAGPDLGPCSSPSSRQSASGRAPRRPAHFLPFTQFEADAARGDLPDFSLIEPNLVLGHNDYHPAVGRALGHDIVIDHLDPPSSILGGEAFLARIYNTYKAMQSPAAGSNVWIATLLIGWDEPGGTYDHVPPPPVPPPDPSAPEGRFGFRFDRSATGSRPS